jgi:serine/threonine-protein kinase RsbW
MSGMGFSFEERGDTKMAVGEAISNAIRHGAKERPRETVAVRCLISPRMLVVEVCDDGLGFDADAYESPREGELLEGGMGIKFMRQCMDEVTFDFSSGTIARLIKHVCI